MRYKQFKYGNKEITNETSINRILMDNNIGWLIDCEFEDADIELKNNTIIWNSGNFYNGDWQYGIFKDGEFHGNFINGIFENGKMKGTFISGIRN